MEEKKNTRRSFIKKFATAGAAAFVATKTGFGLTQSESTKTESVKNIKALGFQWETKDPFLFCVHHEDYFPEGNEQMGPNPDLLKGRNIGSDFMVKDGFRMYHGSKVPGFPGHPHRGFETVTVVRKGMVDHSDSMKASGRYGDGDVQWMTAGKGIQHAEMFPLIHENKPNTMELFQIWLNLPSNNKMVEPHFKMLWNESIPNINHIDSEGKKTEIEVISGSLLNKTAPTPPPNSWANNPSNEVAIWNIHMEAGATFTLPKTTKGINRTIYFYKGDSLKVNDAMLPHYHSADVDETADLKLISGTLESRILILQGKPINEPVVQHGPFVMNTREEIQQAFFDYQQTHFGGWPWNEMGPVHERSKGRFAYHADGKKEDKA